MRTDPLSDALQMVRPRLAAYDVGRLERSWGVRLQAVEGASFIAVGEGQTLLGAEPLRAPLRLGAGDAALLPHGAAACLKDRADRPLTAPGAHPFAAHAPVSSTRAVPSDPARRDGPSAVVITGIIEFDQRMAAPLLRSLPPVIHLPHRQTATGRWLAQSISLIGRKLQPPAPGSEALMAQCFGLFFTQTLCALAAGEARVLPSGVLPQGLIRGLRDAAITQALQAFHQA